jgi:ribosomal protein S18 acetylase RimI-like enzyme
LRVTGATAIAFTGRPPARVVAAMEANMIAHMAHLPSLLPSATVVRAPDMVLVDSGVPSDTFTVVCGARLDPTAADDRIAAAIDHFRAKGALFACWVGPTSRPANLGERLLAHGLVEAEVSLGMALDLARLPALTPPAGLVVKGVATSADLATYARILAANFEPPDQGVINFYERAAEDALAPDSPERFYLGYLGTEPVATSESVVGHGVVGIYAITTLGHARRRGIGTAMTAAPLLEARAAGLRTATLQASVGGQSIYRRLGFVPCGTFREYKPSAEG